MICELSRCAAVRAAVTTRHHEPRSTASSRVSAIAATTVLAAWAAYPVRAAERVEEVTVLAPRSDTIGLASTTQIGSRLDVSALELPLSISRVDQESIQAKGQTTVTDAATGTTGLVGHVRAGAPGVYSWRGFTENAVATLYDGIRVQGSTVTTRLYDAFAFERIEVARGPASALHGEGALGGAINYVRKLPRRDGGVASEVVAGAGSYGSWRAGMGVNAQLGTSTYARADVVHQSFETQVRGNENDLTHAVGSVLWDLTPAVSMLLQIDHLQVDVDDAYWGTPLIGTRIPFELRRVNYNNVIGNRYREDVTWLRWDTTWQVADGVAFTNQAYSYQADRDWRNTGRFLWNPATATVGRTFWEDLAYDHELYGDRAMITVDREVAGRRNQLLAGVDASRTQFASPRNSSLPFGLQQQVDPFDPAPVDFFAFGRPRVRARETDIEQWAVFVENRLEVTPQLALHGTLRRDELAVDFARYDATPAQFYRARYEPTTWNVGATYRVLPQSTLYAQYGTSATPPDSLLVIADAVTAGFDLTKGQGVELGFKQLARDGRVEWTAAVYQLEQRDIPSNDPDDPTRIRLIGEQRSRGVELALAWRPVPSLLIEANAAVLEAEFVRFFEGSVSRAGNRPPNVSEQVFNLEIDYALTPRWSAGASARYVGDFAANTSNSIVFPSYTLADLRLRYALSAATDISLFVNNAFDERYAVWATGAGGQNAMANIGAPRTFGAQLRMRFGAGR